MKRQDFLKRFFVTAALLSVLTFVSTGNAFAQTDRPNPTGDGTAPVAAAGFVSGLFTLLPGQSVRVSAVNMGKKAIPVQIVFVPVSEQGKAGVSVLCDLLPAPGDAAFDKYSIPDGTSNRQLMYVQIRVRDAKDLESIAPSLEVFNEQPNIAGPHIFMSGADFIEIRPIWVPS